jgi:DNA helicase-2/ATP-dependent DNA helicase PcrA
MTAFPGPAELGRGIVTSPGQRLPSSCESWPRLVLDDEVLAAPAAAAAELHLHWLRREPVIVVLTTDAGSLRAPERFEGEPFELEVGFEFARERLQFLVWSNNYDARAGAPIWWHGRRAERLGAAPDDAADVRLSSGAAAWCDGGPRRPFGLVEGAVVVHRDSIEGGSLEPDRDAPVTAALAADQLAAVAHGAGPARIIAPAGSGKTRVLTERLRHLLADRGVTPANVTAVAFNRRAADELRERTGGLPAHIRTLNALGLAVVNGGGAFATAGGSRRRVIDESEVRRILESLVTVRRQLNTDAWIPYLDALSAIRLGLQDPEDVEAAMPDAAGIAGVFGAYRSILAEQGLLDFDEQIYAAIELLLRRPDVRHHDQRLARHLLVDEFQDLTPAHLLLLRLLSAPAYDVFGVGDDDQVIYSYAGATPEFLIDYGRYFPGAAEYALEVNYRCPPTVVDGARHLLTHNLRRIGKAVRAAPGREVRVADLRVEPLPLESHAAAAAGQIRRWAGEGARYEEMAVLSRVNSSLLPVQVTLRQAGIPASSPVGIEMLRRTGIRAALAYLRIGAEPERVRRADVAETMRRPSRRIARNVAEMLQRRPTTSIAGIRRLARALSGADADKLDRYAEDLERIAVVVSSSTTAHALRAIREEIGLGSAMDALDASRREADRSTHLDDLAALEQVAALHPQPATFESWLIGLLGGKAETPAAPGITSDDGPETPSAGLVTLSTVHRVKGREWPHVIVFGVGAESFPHRLSSDTEEERRVFHVALTRCSEDVVVIGDRRDPSRFTEELGRDAPAAPPSLRRERDSGRRPEPGRRDGKGTGKGPGGRKATGDDSPPMAALRAWRRETAARENVPAYVIFSDAHLAGIAAALPTSERALARCAGVGPVKLERYGDELLAILELFLKEAP